MRLAHLSDLHFGSDVEALSASLIADLRSQELDLVVVSGDFTQHGTDSEFREAREFLEALPAPLFAVPGNHDFPQVNLFRRLLNPYARYRRYISDDLEPFLAMDGVALAGIKTAHRAMPGLNWSHGSVSSRQLRLLRDRFAAVEPQTVRVVVAHHPLLYPEGVTRMRQERAWHADVALETLSELGVRLVLSGHFHLSYVRAHVRPGAVKEGAPTGLRESAVAPILVAQTSSTLSTRLRGHPNAYNLVNIDQDRIEIDVREWRNGTWLTREREEKPAAA